MSRRHFIRYMKNQNTRERDSTITHSNSNTNSKTLYQNESVKSSSSNVILPNDNSLNLNLSENTNFFTDNNYYSNIVNNNISENNINYNLFENDNDSKSPLKDKLSKLISKYHISHNCVNELLVILRSEGLKVPKDARSLLKTPKSNSHNIINIENGSYIYIGI